LAKVKFSQNKKIKELKKKQISDELEQLKSAYEEIQDIFAADGETSWYDKPQFKRLIETLDTKGDLDRHSLEVNSRLKDQKSEHVKLANLQQVLPSHKTIRPSQEPSLKSPNQISRATSQHSNTKPLK
jgi:hypothetical protein